MAVCRLPWPLDLNGFRMLRYNVCPGTPSQANSCCAVQDLLQPRAVELTLREGPEGAIEVPGLREVEVCSLEDCLGLLQLGDRNR